MSDEINGEIIELVEGMLRRSIDYWRKSDKDYAEYYVDAYRCTQHNMEEIIHTLRKTARNE